MSSNPCAKKTKFFSIKTEPINAINYTVLYLDSDYAMVGKFVRDNCGQAYGF